MHVVCLEQNAIWSELVAIEKVSAITNEILKLFSQKKTHSSKNSFRIVSFHLGVKKQK